MASLAPLPGLKVVSREPGCENAIVDLMIINIVTKDWNNFILVKIILLDKLTKLY